MRLRNTSARRSSVPTVTRPKSRSWSSRRALTISSPPWPGGGPGWCPAGTYTGNFVLSELTLQAASGKNPDHTRSIALRNASADFSQVGWDIRGAVDGNTGRGWAVWPEFNKDHTAVFEMA